MNAPPPVMQRSAQNVLVPLASCIAMQNEGGQQLQQWENKGKIAKQQLAKTNDFVVACRKHSTPINGKNEINFQSTKVCQEMTKSVRQG